MKTLITALLTVALTISAQAEILKLKWTRTFDLAEAQAVDSAMNSISSLTISYNSPEDMRCGMTFEIQYATVYPFRFLYRYLTIDENNDVIFDSGIYTNLSDKSTFPIMWDHNTAYIRSADMKRLEIFNINPDNTLTSEAVVTTEDNTPIGISNEILNKPEDCPRTNVRAQLSGSSVKGFGGVDISRTYKYYETDATATAPAIDIEIVAVSGIDNGNALVSWTSQVGKEYQIMRSTDLTTWENVGQRITGTGADMRYSEPVLNNERLFFKVCAY